MEFFHHFYNVVGITGVVLLLIAYYFLNINRLSSESMTYQLLNMFGALFILFSLLFDWNVSSFLIEVAWVIISAIGIYNIYTRRINHSDSK